MQLRRCLIQTLSNRILIAGLGALMALLMLGALAVQAATVTVTIPVGVQPAAAVVNPVTNKIYIASGGSDSVTVIDGATYTTTTVSVGASPRGVAVN